MPYIKSEDRPLLDELVEKLAKRINSSGDLNYVITSLLHHEVVTVGKNYENLNRLQGVVDCVGKEFYRKVVSPYEDLKIKINGDLNILTGDE